MSPRTPKAASPSAPDQPKHWGFFLDGKFTDKGNHNRNLTALIRQLVELRRTTEDTPAACAARIREAGLQSAFGVISPVLANWDSLDNYEHWPIAWSSTSASEAIKRAGYGCPGRPRWCDCGVMALRDTACQKCRRHEDEAVGVFRPEVQEMLDVW